MRIAGIGPAYCAHRPPAAKPAARSVRAPTTKSISLLEGSECGRLCRRRIRLPAVRGTGVRGTGVRGTGVPGTGVPGTGVPASALHAVPASAVRGAAAPATAFPGTAGSRADLVVECPAADWRLAAR